MHKLILLIFIVSSWASFAGKRVCTRVDNNKIRFFKKMESEIKKYSYQYSGYSGRLTYEFYDGIDFEDKRKTFHVMKRCLKAATDKETKSLRFKRITIFSIKDQSEPYVSGANNFASLKLFPDTTIEQCVEAIMESGVNKIQN
ncbi:hypothetical protein N9N67_11365 [Bacteriovoracaceae bacterium]|nr:hypothetical protein [Bacteriovoracaceae bacterium]